MLQGLEHRDASERRPAGEQLVEDRPQTVNVGRGAHLLAFALGLLGGHVTGRPDDRPADRQGGGAFGPLHQPEIGHLGDVVAAQENVAGLDVAMDQAPRVRGRDAARQTLDQTRRAFRGQGSAVQPLLQAPPLQVFQLQVREPADLAEGVDLDHVRMLQLGDGLGFILKPLSRRGVGVRAGQDHLQRADAVEPDLPGLVNDAHPATAEFAQNFITGNGRRDPRPPVEPRSSRRGRAPVVVQRLRRMIRGGRPAVHRCGRVVVDLVIGERQGRGKYIPLRERRRRRIKNHVAGALGLGLRGPILRAERIVRLCLAQFKPIAAVHSSPLPR